MKLRNFFLCLLMGGVLAGIPSISHADNWWDVFFPQGNKKTGNEPTNEGRAPFADKDVILDGPTIEERMTGNTSPLHVRHRLNADVAQWVEAIVSEMLAYDSVTYKQEYAKKAKTFDKKGLEEYVKFMQDSKIVKTLDSGAYNLRSFVQDVPILMNEGAIAERYRWLYQVKVMITYVPVSMKQYDKTKVAQMINKNIVINLQIGRAEKADNEHGVLIESWVGKIEGESEE